MPSVEIDDSDQSEHDELRSSLLADLQGDLGDVLLEHHLVPGKDLWIRVSTERWSDIARYLFNSKGFSFFDWLSAIDWLPSPYGRSLESEVDRKLGKLESEESTSDQPASGADGFAGGTTRFQVLARVFNLDTAVGVTLKVDLPEGLTVGTWVDTYPGAAWHEREAYEMFGISFSGHKNLRNIYLPTGFEGNPLRKDYPLLARLVKPWPGIVDVEQFPVEESGSTQGPTTTNPGMGGNA